jgi:hypothetical protein
VLDVHPPHHPTHTWKDFFIHIATIVIGLLIAVGLEQTVEAIHHHREATDLRERLRVESEQILYDARRAEAAELYQLQWLSARLDQARTAIARHTPLAPEPPDLEPYFASPDIPQWRTAHTSGLAERLTASELTGYAEIEYVQTRVLQLDVLFDKAQGDLRTFDLRLPRLPNGEPDFHQASPQDLETYLTLISVEYNATRTYLNWIRLIIGAELAVTSGKLNLEDIYKSEREAGKVSDQSNPHRF